MNDTDRSLALLARPLVTVSAILLLLLCAITPAIAQSATDAPLWSVKPVRKPAAPAVKNAAWVRNPIDAFVLARLEAKRMQPAPAAGRRELLRRLTFDLTGLPPTAEEIAAFEADRSPDAYEKRVDRLLASPRYGERWARYWLDLVRYADSNGYERDAEKPYSWKYRDYVIRSLNEDKPYDRFVTEQLAGDELPDRNEATITATGFLRLGTWDDEPNDPYAYKYERLDDLVHATATAFLGLTVRCARCHDHKFDPIPQRDYYAFAANFYGGYLDAGDAKLAGGPPQDKLGAQTLGFTDRGPQAAPLKLLLNGDPLREAAEVGPGYLSLVSGNRRDVAPPPPGAATTHRRLQLAEWITDPRNPLTPRVIVNRVWQHHFGQGLVRTPNNFGRKGSPPTNPELLDWLASEFAGGEKLTTRSAGDTETQRNAEGVKAAGSAHHGFAWRLKPLHRLIVTSAAYRMGSLNPHEAEYARTDSANENMWRFDRQRLDADALRDSILAVSGQLNLKVGGPGFFPTVTREALEGLSRKGAEWTPSLPEEQNRRTIYMFLKRAMLLPLLTVFDFADTAAPLEQRDVTTVAPQALALMNNPFVSQQSEAFARRVEAEAGTDPARRVKRAWQLAFARSPSPDESREALAFLASQPAPLAATSHKSQAASPALWLRADAGVTAGADGRVSAWADQSAARRDAVQPVSAAQPLLVRNALNGAPALRFDGKGSFLTIASQVLTSQEFAIFAVVSDRAADGHREIFSNWNRAGNIGTAVFLGATGASSARLTDDFSPVGVLSHRERPFILTGISAPASVAVYQDRNEIAKRVSSMAPRKLEGPYVIGQQGNIDGEYWNGDILELRVYNRALTDEERDGIWDELNARYDIAPRPRPVPPGLVSLCHVLLNANEFVYVD
ncbi:MAG TPA: DUF1549 domain-containing protein [Chthonomonadaceae bacterium]|nr:DUF1549 domain-containing protein [Chthonomonadaceae bacterium]